MTNKHLEDFNLLWGLSPKGSLKYKKGKEIKSYILNREKALLENYILKKDSSYVQGYEDCLEEKYDKAQKHFEKKLKLYKTELEGKVEGMLKSMERESRHFDSTDKPIRNYARGEMNGKYFALLEFLKIIKQYE